MRFSFFAATLACAATLAAHADTFQTFSASGVFQSGSTLSGTLTLDQTSGIFTGIDLQVGAPDLLTFQTLVSQTSYNGNQTVVVSSPNTPSTQDLYLSFNQGSLVGYNGGDLPSISNNGGSVTDVGGPAYVDDLYKGSLSAVTPEPSSFLLLGTGLLGALGVARKRFA